MKKLILHYSHHVPENTIKKIMPKNITFKIKRQDSDITKSYWETFSVPYVSNSNVISCLMQIQANPINDNGDQVTPVVWESNCLE